MLQAVTLQDSELQPRLAAATALDNKALDHGNSEAMADASEVHISSYLKQHVF